MSVKGNKLFAVIYIVIFAAGALFILFNDYGVLKYYSLRGEVKELNTKISNAEKNLEALKVDIDSLRQSDMKIEEVAREKYRMHRDNEKALKVEEEKLN